MPARKNALCIERRELLLNRVQESEINAMFTTRMSFSQDRYRLARIMITVVKEKHDFAANFLLKLSGGDNLGIEKSFWKKAARLLPETDNRRGHGC
jgi:hypothetical protein